MQYAAVIVEPAALREFYRCPVCGPRPISKFNAPAKYLGDAVAQGRVAEGRVDILRRSRNGEEPDGQVMEQDHV